MPGGRVFGVTPLPGNDLPVADRDEQAPAAVFEIDPVDLDFSEDLTGGRKGRGDTPTPVGLVPEGAPRAASMLGLGEFAVDPCDDSGELVSCGEVCPAVSG